MRFACVLLTLAAIVGIAEAASCRARVVVAAKPAVVVKKEVAVAVVAPVVPVAVYAPVAVYGAIYTPPVPAAPAVTTPAGVSPAPASSAGDLRTVLEALKALDERLKRLEGGSPPPSAPPKMQPADPFAPKAPVKTTSGAAAIIQAKCASCHSASSAASKGADLVLLDAAGNLASLTDRQARRLATMVYSGRMPPAKSGVAPLTDQEVGEVMALLETLK